MSLSKASQLLKDGAVVASVGSRPRVERNALKVAASAIVISFALAMSPQASAQNVSYSNMHKVQSTGYNTQADGIPATVLSVRNDRQYDRAQRAQERNRRRAGNIVENIAGSLLGGLIDNAVDNRTVSRHSRSIARVGVNTVSSRVMERRNKSKDIVTVRAKINGRYQVYEISQPDTINLHRGDSVYIVTASNGNALVVPRGPTNSHTRRDRFSY